ncbi:MAG: LysM peptidoglycan-binding domain-containing protein [Phycisphaeraceae bacterium]|nr:LysM peptidoglycan-binding domain-containing protein [Phycisphaeraceae bacterium]
MSATPWRLFLAIAALVLIWIMVFWLYEPPPPPVSFGDRPAGIESEVTEAATAGGDTRRDPGPLAAKPEPARPVAVSSLPVRTEVNPQPYVATRAYVVQSGDVSWERIAARVLGDRRRAEEIARQNPLVSPDKLIPGRTVLRVPAEPAVAASGAPAKPPANVPVAATPKKPEPAPEGERQYTIAAKDTLSGIAKSVYGQSSLWEVIYEANRDRLSSPNRLPLGVVIRIPPKPAAAAGAQGE